MPVHVGADKQKHPRSVDAFCARNGICKASFYNLVKRGQAPEVLKIGARTTITEEAEAEWKRRHTSQLIAA
jgi:predicted DNA-binding transcriptional regulator AlpA